MCVNKMNTEEKRAVLKFLKLANKVEEYIKKCATDGCNKFNICNEDIKRVCRDFELNENSEEYFELILGINNKGLIQTNEEKLKSLFPNMIENFSDPICVPAVLGGDMFKCNTDIECRECIKIFLKETMNSAGS